MRIIEVVHDRLGGTTRQLAHEMTHAVDPGDAMRRLQSLAASLRAVSSGGGLSDNARAALADGAAEAEALAAVGMPPRGGQFTASAQVLLHRTDLAENAFALPARGGYDVPARYRGLDVSLVEELARVRTDFDALEPHVVDLLVAQGYFLTDFMTKLTMPDLVFEGHASRDWYGAGLQPSWQPAHDAVQEANANGAAVVAELAAAAKRDLFIGRVRASGHRWRYRANLTLIGVLVLAVLVPTAGWLVYGVWKIGLFAVGALLDAVR
jgi:hypothetical protein